MAGESLVEAVRQSIETPRRDWFSRLPPDHQEQVEHVRRAWRDGEISGSARAVARSLIQHCQKHGIRICGFDGVREWLAKRD